MTIDTMTAVVDRSYDETLSAARAELAREGFGVLTEIDVSETLRDKLGVESAAQVILGACRPELAHRALDAVPSVAALLPCNVVVRDLGSGTTLVEIVDPELMARLADDDALQEVAAEAKQRLIAVIKALAAPSPVEDAV